MKRRTFFKYLSLSLLGIYLGKNLFKKKFKGKLLGPSMNYGHKVRDHLLTINTKNNQKYLYKKVVIIGGGIAGLSSAWWFKRNNFNDFILLELENKLGGNSQGGENSITNYPWGAHYIPIANLDSEYQKILFEELGIIEKYDKKTKLPIYNELFLCHDQEERLFKDGKWQSGLIPERGLQAAEKKEIKRFLDLMEQFKILKGSDQKFAFNIPLAFSSKDEQFLKLDKISMKSWLESNNFKTKPLLWYINYCCLDDYGIGLEEVSAYTGIHYFAGRKGQAHNAESNSVVTWAEGNNYIVKKLQEYLNPSQIQANTLVCKIKNLPNKQINIEYLNTINNKKTYIKCDYIIFAAPRFMAKHIIKDLPVNLHFNNLKYTPWLVSNITLSEFDYQMAWDNVNYHSESLGYILANHQKINTHQNKSIITYYSALKAQNRHLYQYKTHSQWAEEIINDLKKIHSDIDQKIENIDIWLWGHGMISPIVNSIWGGNRQEMLKPYKNIYFAHSDMSGISIFEEAQYHGVSASEQILKLLGF